MVTPSQTPDAPSRQIVIAIAPRTLWTIVAIAVSIILTFAFLRSIITILVLLFIAIVLAEGMRPLMNRLVQRHVPRSLAVLLIFIVVLAILLLLGWWLSEPLIQQVTTLLNKLPTYISQAQQAVAQLQKLVHDNPDLVSTIQSITNQVGSSIASLLKSVLVVPLTFIQLIFSFVIVLTATFFWLTSIDDLQPFVLGLLPEPYRPRAVNMLSEASLRIGGYVQGVLIDMLAVGVVSGLGMALLGVPFSLLLGVLAGLTEALPYIGPYIGGGAAVLVALFSIGPLKAVEVLVLYEVIQQLEGNLLVPLVMHRTVKLHPLIVLFSVIIGAQLLGIIGAVLAVPVAVLVEMVVVQILAPLARSVAARHTEAIQIEGPEAGKLNEG